MANVRRGNVHYIDATGNLTERTEDKVIGVIVTATAASAVLVLSDTSDNNLMDLRVVASGESKLFSFKDFPVYLSSGLKAKTVTNCVATVLYTNSTGGAGK